MKNILFIFYFFLLGGYCFAQLNIKAVVKDSATKMLIPYSEVVTASKKFGTVADEKGYFELILPDSLKNDFLVLSCVGYNKKNLPVTLFLNQTNVEIFLSVKTTILPEIAIVPIDYDKFCKESRGIKKHRGNGSFDFRYGFEIAIFISNTSADSGIISALKFYVASDGYPKTPFRAKLYYVNPADSSPGELLSEQNFIMQAKGGNRWVKLDVKDLNIAIPKNGFFLSMEWLPDSKNSPYKTAADKKGFYSNGQSLGLIEGSERSLCWMKFLKWKRFEPTKDGYWDPMIAVDELIKCK